jgi:ubiquinone/menaquinone biosynthesis C-methylase UbiE
MFLKRDNPHTLVVGMAGVKMGDRLLQIGCAHGGRLGAIAAKVGLSGRAVAVVPDADHAMRARKGAEDAGVLVDVHAAPPTTLPVEDAAFDVVVADDAGGLFGTLTDADLRAAVREIARVLRPGGRVVMIGATPATGLGAMLSRGAPAPPFVSSGGAVKALNANGFRSARIIGEREGLAFAEALKPRAAEGG